MKGLKTFTFNWNEKKKKIIRKIGAEKLLLQFSFIYSFRDTEASFLINEKKSNLSDFKKKRNWYRNERKICIA